MKVQKSSLVISHFKHSFSRQIIAWGKSRVIWSFHLKLRPLSWNRCFNFALTLTFFAIAIFFFAAPAARIAHRSATNWNFSRRLLEILFKTTFKNHHLWKIKNIFKNEIIEDIEEKCIFYNYFFKVFPNECLYLSHFNVKTIKMNF